MAGCEVSARAGLLPRLLSGRDRLAKLVEAAPNKILVDRARRSILDRSAGSAG